MRKKILAYIILLSLSMSACGKDKKVEESIPELLEPISINESFSPVCIGNIGIPETLIGTVVPEEYCQFYGTAVTIKELLVETGDVVKKGDLLAVADDSKTLAAKENLENELKSVHEEFEIYKKNVNREILDFQEQKKEADDLTKAQLDVQIAVAKENLNYDTIMQERREEKLRERIKEQEEMLIDTNLYATHDGVVTYVKDIRAGFFAASTEAIAIISNTEDKYIDVDMDYYAYAKMRDMDLVYTYINDKREDIREINYSNDVLVYAKTEQCYPCVRLTCDSLDELDFGANVMIYAYKDCKENVLMVENRSINNDGQDYVYVLSEDGSKKRKNIEKGVSDDRYTEIISGLEQGDMVLFETDETIPVDTGSTVVERDEYKSANNSIHFERSHSVSFLVRAGYDGELVEVNDSLEDTIKEGDYICSIKTQIGKAMITEKYYELIGLKEEKDLKIAELDKRLVEYREMEDAGDYIDNAINDLQAEKAMLAASYDSQIKTKQEEYDYLVANNDGTGIIKIYSPYSGYISNWKCQYLAAVNSETELLTVTDPGGDKAIFDMTPKGEHDSFPQDVSNLPSVFETVKVKGQTKDYEATCIGMTSFQKKFVQSKDGRVYALSTGDNKYEPKSFFIGVNDEDLFSERNARAQFLRYDVLDVIMLSSDYINIDSEGYTYVWKKNGDLITRQYILTDNLLSDSYNYCVIYGIAAGDEIVRGNVK